MHTSIDFINKVTKCNPQIPNKSLPLLKKAFEAGVVEGRIKEKLNRLDMTYEIKGLLNDFNNKTQTEIFELTDYQDHTWPFILGK